MFDVAGYQILWTFVGMMCQIRLAHFDTNLCHESLMQLATQLASSIAAAEAILSRCIFPFHVVYDFKETTFLTLAFAKLAAILAASHFSLMPGGYRRGITVALHGEKHEGHVWVHELAVAT